MKNFRQFYKLLLKCHGPEAAAVRHEIYFLCQGHRRWQQALRGFGALVRDCFILYTAKKAKQIDADLLAVVTLKGASGWGSLKRAVALARSAAFRVAIVVHPRVRSIPSEDVLYLPRPSIGTMWKALCVAWRCLFVSQPQISSVMVAATVVRHFLWEEAWRKALGMWSGAILLHNDFDMMSRSAVHAAQHKRPTICVQHGIPTDEFFPAAADFHMVWGQTSAQVYQREGVDAERLILNPLGREKSSNIPQEAPHSILLISQTHTPVYGIDLRLILKSLAHGLASSFTPVPVRVLLHPREIHHGHPYGDLRGLDIEFPPHGALSSPVEPHLVVGFSSTALLEAAMAGHYVLGLDWSPRASLGAYSVSAPRLKATDARHVIKVFKSLCTSPEARRAHAQSQIQWLRATFARGGERFAELLKRVL